jgi:hypothetical protein
MPHGRESLATRPLTIPHGNPSRWRSRGACSARREGLSLPSSFRHRVLIVCNRRYGNDRADQSIANPDIPQRPMERCRLHGIGTAPSEWTGSSGSPASLASLRFNFAPPKEVSGLTCRLVTIGQAVAKRGVSFIWEKSEKRESQSSFGSPEFLRVERPRT